MRQRFVLTGNSTCAKAPMGRGMYALTSRPSKIISNARFGPPKTLNNLETRDVDKQQPDAVVMSSPKPVFNGNRARHHQNVRPSSSSPQSHVFSTQHEEIVRYLNEAWSRVNHEMERKVEREGGPVIYKEKNPNPRLHGFQAFDLASFWGERFLKQVTESKS